METQTHTHRWLSSAIFVKWKFKCFSHFKISTWIPFGTGNKKWCMKAIGGSIIINSQWNAYEKCVLRIFPHFYRNWKLSLKVETFQHHKNDQIGAIYVVEKRNPTSKAVSRPQTVIIFTKIRKIDLIKFTAFFLIAWRRQKLRRKKLNMFRLWLWWVVNLSNCSYSLLNEAWIQDQNEATDSAQ